MNNFRHILGESWSLGALVAILYSFSNILFLFYIRLIISEYSLLRLKDSFCHGRSGVWLSGNPLHQRGKYR
jgi:hypothetical protein